MKPISLFHLWKWRYNRMYKTKLFSDNKFNDRKENPLTKYYCVRGKLTVFKKIPTFPFNDQLQ